MRTGPYAKETTRTTRRVFPAAFALPLAVALGLATWGAADGTSATAAAGEDNPAVRDLLAMLPLTITVEEFAGRERISYLPRALRHRGSPGYDPESGDLIYFVPWGNLGFYYNAEGIGYSDDTIHLGTYDARLDQLERLEGEVDVEVVG